MGGTKPWPEVPVGNADHTTAAVVIIGAGVSGMCTAIDLIRQNKCHNFVILERSSQVGGTWHDNKYPGCACDVFSMLYSFSFEQNPDWTRLYPGQEEILDYLIKCASKYNLYKYVRFNSSVESSTWDESTKQWKTKVKVSGSKDAEFGTDYTISSDFLVSAVGQLNQPKYPDIDGLKSFSGRTMHSSRWDWTYDIRDKRIAIIGNGATAAQIIPELAKVAKHLTIHQRTPNWVVNRLDTAIPPWQQAMFKYVPLLQSRTRSAMMDFRESVFAMIEDQNSDIAQFFMAECKDKIQASFPDDLQMREALTPKYSIGCKRILISDDFYPALAQDNVRLETRPISKIIPSGVSVRIPGTEQETSEAVDLIVLATGFNTINFMHPINITGRNGRNLGQVWENGAAAYKGVTVEDLPNFGMLYGPNTNLGHNSIILMIEQQSRYINRLIGAVLDARRTAREGTNLVEKDGPPGSGSTLALTPKKAVVDAHNEEMQKQLSLVAFADPKCNSWYKDPASGRVVNNWSGTVVDYQKALKDIDWNDYEGGEEVMRMRNGQEKVNVGRVVEETLVSDRALVALSVLGVAVGAAGWAWRNQRAVSGMLMRR